MGVESDGGPFGVILPFSGDGGMRVQPKMAAVRQNTELPLATSHLRPPTTEALPFGGGRRHCGIGGRSPVPGFDGGAPLPRCTAGDGRDRPLCCPPSRSMAGALGVLGTGAEVQSARPLDRLGLWRSVQPSALCHQQLPLPDSPRRPAQPGLAGSVAVQAPPSLRLASALRPSAAWWSASTRPNSTPPCGRGTRPMAAATAHWPSTERPSGAPQHRPALSMVGPPPQRALAVLAGGPPASTRGRHARSRHRRRRRSGLQAILKTMCDGDRETALAITSANLVRQPIVGSLATGDSRSRFAIYPIQTGLPTAPRSGFLTTSECRSWLLRVNADMTHHRAKVGWQEQSRHRR